MSRNYSDREYREAQCYKSGGGFEDGKIYPAFGPDRRGAYHVVRFAWGERSLKTFVDYPNYHDELGYRHKGDDEELPSFYIRALDACVNDAKRELLIVKETREKKIRPYVIALACVVTTILSLLLLHLPQWIR